MIGDLRITHKFTKIRFIMELANTVSENPAHSLAGCYHCGEPVPAGSLLSVSIGGRDQPMCCRGCQAVCRTIIDYGLEDYYRFRTRLPPAPEQQVPEVLRELAVFDNPKIQQQFIRQINADNREANLIIEGIVCPACIWLNERHIGALPGVLNVAINYTNNRACITWDNTRIKLSDILRAITGIGYTAHPYSPYRDQLLLDRERKSRLQRLGLAGFLGMQVMMNSIALYTGEWSGMDANVKHLLYWLNLILTTPIVFFSAQPFFKGAWRDLRQLRTGMDVPISLGIGIAYAGCIWPTVTGHGQVYFDSVAMFVFLLLLGRYFEFMARKSAREHFDNISHILPATAIRLNRTDGIPEEETVPVIDLVPGDRVLVRAGETIPADGVVTEGASTVNESLLTGESLPVTKQAGSSLIAGSINIESPLQMSVKQIGAETVLSQLLNLVERAQHQKPRFSQLANRISGWFVLAVLIITLLAGGYWWSSGMNIWLPITLSILVATCPCALSLATPTAMTAAITALLKQGIAITQVKAVENLNRISHVIFDKTGTLTMGKLKLDSIQPLSEIDQLACLSIAAALEKHSEHPVGRAILDSVCGSTVLMARDITNFPGQGITGGIGDTQYSIGTLNFISNRTGLTPASGLEETLTNGDNTTIFLADSNRLLCVFTFRDEIRPHAGALIGFIKKTGRKVILLSGDRAANVRKIGETLHIDIIIPEMRPEDKLIFIRKLQEQNAIVAMVGDGVNDAPVLACADVSIAMGGGTDIAKINADIILLNDQLDKLQNAMNIAHKTFVIIRQNIIWAIVYNLLILPSAAMGFIAPWLAALGMSLSSLVVVANASRIK